MARDLNGHKGTIYYWIFPSFSLQIFCWEVLLCSYMYDKLQCIISNVNVDFFQNSSSLLEIYAGNNKIQEMREIFNLKV